MTSYPLLSHFLRDRTGNIAVTAGLLFPVVLGIAALAMDGIAWYKQKHDLQDVADSAAVAAARELISLSPDESRIRAIATSLVRAHQSAATARVEASLTQNGTAVVVTLTDNVSAHLSRAIGMSDQTVRVTAMASAVGERICVIALETAAGNTLSLQDRAKLTAPTCSVYANSGSSAAIVAQPQTLLTSRTTCVAGGYTGPRASFTPVPTTDCPRIPDPLAQRPPPPVGACIANNLTIDTSRTLQPGTYCGG